MKKKTNYKEQSRNLGWAGVLLGIALMFILTDNDFDLEKANELYRRKFSKR